MFDQMIGYHSLAKLTHKFNHHSPSPQEPIFTPLGVISSLLRMHDLGGKIAGCTVY